jgi:hypothetical protein
VQASRRRREIEEIEEIAEIEAIEEIGALCLRAARRDAICSPR